MASSRGSRTGREPAQSGGGGPRRRGANDRFQPDVLQPDGEDAGLEAAGGHKGEEVGGALGGQDFDHLGQAEM